MAGGVNVPVTSTWNPAGVNKAKADLGSFQRNMDGSLGKVAKSWKGVAAGALGAFGASAVVGQLREMAGAAVEDEASVSRLAVALRNLGLSASQSGVEDFVKNTMLATGVADDQLRPALARLLRSTESVAESQAGVNRALNISAGTGKSLDAVVSSLGRAYDGNTTSLGRLGVGLDKALLKSGDMVAINAELDRKFGGSSAAAAETYAGKLLRVSTAADEAKESIGYGLLGALDDVSASLGGTDGVVSLIADAGDTLGDFTRGLGESATGIATWLDAVNTAGDATGETGVSLLDMGQAMIGAIPGISAVTGLYGQLADKGRAANQAEKELNDEVNKSITLRHMYTAKIDEEAAATARLTAEMERNKKQRDHLSARSSVEAAIDAFGGLDSQGTRSWKDKHGKTHTSTFTKQFRTDWNSKRDTFNLGTEAGRQGWDAAKALIDATISEASLEGPKKAAATFKYGRKNLVEQLTGIGVPKAEARAFAGKNLGTPSEITREIHNNQKTTIQIDARGRSQAEVNALVARAHRLAMIGTAPQGALSAVDATTPWGGRGGATATERGLGPAS